MSTLLLIIVIVICSIGCLWGWRLVFATFIHDIRNSSFQKPRQLDGLDISCGVLIATFGSPFWPLFLLYIMGKKVMGGADAETIALKIAGRSKEERQEDREKSLKERERRLEKMERELNIGPFKT